MLEKHAHRDVDQDTVMAMLVLEQRRTNRLLTFVACVTGVLAVLVVGMHLADHWHWGL
jgi:ubiquinone biosynthesis protein